MITDTRVYESIDRCPNLEITGLGYDTHDWNKSGEGYIVIS